MNPILATTIVAGTTWLANIDQNKNLTTNHFVAFFVLAVLLGLLSTVDAKLANTFSWLVVVATILGNGETLYKLVSPK